jgi:hypothetical protein
MYKLNIDANVIFGYFLFLALLIFLLFHFLNHLS